MTYSDNSKPLVSLHNDSQVLTNMAKGFLESNNADRSYEQVGLVIKYTSATVIDLTSGEVIFWDAD
jgi:hypothetical protein